MSCISDSVYIAKGIGITALYSFLSLAIGFCLGTVLAIFKTKSCGFYIRGFVDFFRSTPLMLQIFAFYLCLPKFSHLFFKELVTISLTLGLNSAAYVTEILYSGIQSIDKTQFDSAKILGIQGVYLWKDVVLPQVFKNVFFALLNEVTSIIKETTLIYVIGGLDIMRRAHLISCEKMSVYPWFIAAICYYIFIKCVTYLGYYFYNMCYVENREFKHNT